MKKDRHIKLGLPAKLWAIREMQLRLLKEKNKKQSK